MDHEDDLMNPIEHRDVILASYVSLPGRVSVLAASFSCELRKGNKMLLTGLKSDSCLLTAVFASEKGDDKSLQFTKMSAEGNN